MAERVSHLHKGKPKLMPFDVDIPQSSLKELRDRVLKTRWAPEPGIGDWSLGVPGEWLQEVAEYWADGFDWRAQEDGHEPLRALSGLAR